MNPHEEFLQRSKESVALLRKDLDFRGISNIWMREAGRTGYFYNFAWLGRPIIQIPNDIYAIQELIWRIKPDLIVETGIAHGGSLILSASLLAILDYCESVSCNTGLDPKKSKRRVIGVDVDIRPHNLAAIESHPLNHLIEMIHGSSIEEHVINEIKRRARNHKTTLVMLDSNHTHEHVLAELLAYGSLVSKGSYCIVWDTSIEDLPEGFVKDRPWSKKNNPKTAVFEYLKILDKEPKLASDGSRLGFEIDKDIEAKIMLTGAIDGFLMRV